MVIFLPFKFIIEPNFLRNIIRSFISGSTAQFLRTVLENGNSSTCFYYANIQIELLKFLLSYNLNQAVSTVSYHILNTIIINILVL